MRAIIRSLYMLCKLRNRCFDNLCLACLKQQRSSAFISCKSVGNFSPGVFLGTKMCIILTINVWSVNNEERKCDKILSHTILAHCHKKEARKYAINFKWWIDKLEFKGLCRCRFWERDLLSNHVKHKQYQIGILAGDVCIKWMLRGSVNIHC